MDYEENINLNSDLIFDKFISVEKSTNIIHKKALALIKGLKDQLKGNQTKGINGIKNYTKSLLTLLEEMFFKLTESYKDEIAFDENVKNADALIFCLAVCVKHIPKNMIKGAIPRIVNILKNFLSLKRFEIRKYSLLIVEKLTLSKDINELKHEDDFFVDFLCDYLLEFFEIKNEEIQKLTAKALSNICKNKLVSEALRYTLIVKIKNFYIAKIRGIRMDKDNLNTASNILLGTEINNIQGTDGDLYLKTISLILQYLPFDYVNEIICELNELIENCENNIIIKSIFLCFDLAFASKTFAVETSEKIFKNILAKEITIDFELNENQYNKDKNHLSIGTSLIISYIKALSSVYANIIRTDPFVSVKYFGNLFSILGEYFSSSDSFVKNNIFNSLNNLINQIFSSNNLDLFFDKNKNTENKDQKLLEDEVIESFEVNLEKTEKFDLKKIYEDMINVIFYLISDRYDDLKPGFNLLLLIIEKIHKKKIF